MDRTFRLTGAGMNQNFVDESPRQAKPVASSTLMGKTEFDFKDLDDNSLQSPKISSAVSACSTTSSLGVLDLEKQSLLSDMELSQNQSRSFVQEQVALSLNRFKERLSNISTTMISCDDEELPSRKNSLLVDGMKSDTTKSASSTRTLTANSFKSPRPSIFDNLSNATSPTLDMGSFVSGKQAMAKLEEDQKENRKQFDSLPVSPINISWNSSENIEERENQFSRIVTAKSYCPEEIPNVLRNKLNLEHKENIKPRVSENKSRSVTFDANKMSSKTNFVPPKNVDIKITSTSETSEKRIQHSSKIPLPKTEFKFNDTINKDIKVAIADSTSLSDAFEESCASSVASIHQIAETLRRKSLMSEPRRAIEHLLSIGTKSKYMPSLASVADVKSDEDTLNASIVTEHTQTPTSSKHTVETPSTITCQARDYKVDSITKKVYATNEGYTPSFITARQLLDSKNHAKTISQSLPICFHLYKGFSVLEIASQRNDVREFWKINPAIVDSKNDRGVTQNSTSELVENYRRKVDKLSRESCSNGPKVNDFTEPVRRISMSQNVSYALESVYADGVDAGPHRRNEKKSKNLHLKGLILLWKIIATRLKIHHHPLYSSSSALLCDNVTNYFLADALDAGILCVGTQVEVIIAVENPSDLPVKYKIVLKSIIANKTQDFSAAAVMLVSEQSDIILSAKTESEIKIVLSPLVEGEIEIVLEFVCEQTNFSNIIHRIKVNGELPKLKVLEPEKPIMHFDDLTAGDSEMLALRLMNEGSARLPLKLIVYEDDRSRMSCWRTIVEPADTFHCYVRATSSQIFNAASDIVYLRGELTVLLDSSEESALLNIVQLQTFQLEARVAQINLLVDCHVPQIITCSAVSKPACCHVRVKNISARIANVITKIFGAHKTEFNIEPKIFEILPNCDQSVKVTFNPASKDRHRQVDVHFCVSGVSRTFSCSVVGIYETDEISPSLSTPPTRKRVNTACNSPNANSHTSSSGSVGTDGPMELDCTHNSISWDSVPLHSKNVQTITLRNRNCQKEKLILSISDSNGTFKFVENELMCRELKLTLEPKESRKISVTFMPFVVDQPVNGRILIMRQHSLESSLSEFRKLVIPLYGIGGKARITYSGVFRDNENRLWITPDSDTFEAKFAVENAGDSVAFVKIVSEDPDDGILPDELILLPKESAEINYTLRLSRDRLDLICKQNPQKEVLLSSKLMVFSGSESTRLRLKKLWSKYKEFENIQRIRDKMESLIDMDIRGPVLVDTLADSQSTLNKLWYEGVTEESIGVLISQQHLEAVCLDSTVVFKDLKDETIIS